MTCNNLGRQRESNFYAQRGLGRSLLRQQQKKNKKNGNREHLSIVSQNFNGVMNENQLEEVHLQMRQHRIGIVCGQEGRRPTKSMTRWDTEELFVAFEESSENVSMKKDGNFFILDAKWKAAFLQGGKKMKRFCPRLVTLRLPLRTTNSYLYIINIHTPDDSKSLAIRRDFQHRFEEAIQEARPNVIAGDVNACTGSSRNFVDGVCGMFGSTYINEAGRSLRQLAATHELVDLLTFEQQEIQSSFHDYRNGQDKQLDKIFMRKDQQRLVTSCRTISMLVSSDHEGVQVNILTSLPRPANKTERQLLAKRDVASSFSHTSLMSKRKEALSAILSEYNLLSGINSEHDKLTKAVEVVLSKLPLSKKSPSGWCDLNDGMVSCCIDDRNRKSRHYAREKSAETRLMYCAARRELKKVKKVARNKWLLRQIEDSNCSLLPGGHKRTGVGAIWNFVRKCKRGNNKWKPWRFSNIRDEHGDMGTSPSANATNFSNYYEKLFQNKSTIDRQDNSATWYYQMKQFPIS